MKSLSALAKRPEVLTDAAAAIRTGMLMCQATFFPRIRCIQRYPFILASMIHWCMAYSSTIPRKPISTSGLHKNGFHHLQQKMVT